MTAAAPSKLRSRLILLLIVTMFFGSFGIAAFLRFTGWKPAGSKNFGELLQPARDLSAIKLTRADGRAYTWAPNEERWQVVFVAPKDCGAPCVRMMDNLHRVWIAQGRQASRVDVLWFGELPAGGATFRTVVPMAANPDFIAALPEASRPDALPVYLVDPGGFLAMRYRPGFDPNGLRKDLSRLLK